MFFDKKNKGMKVIKTKILKGIVLLSMGIIASYAMDEIESRFSDSSFEGVNYTFVDWMHPIGKNIFNKKDFIEQHHVRSQIIEHSFEIAGLIGQTKEDKEKMSLYLRQIANDQNPMGQNPVSIMADKNNPHYKVANNISDVLYKILTQQIVIVEKKAVNAKVFLMSKK